MITYEPVRGMEDYFDQRSKIIRFIEDVFRQTVEKAGYKEAITPIVEDFELFSVKGGEELRKTMYVFKDKANREIALRPEITPSIVRLYLNSLQHYPKPIRIFYVGRVYRYDEPQQGRYREFRQAGVELLGSDSTIADIEILQLLENFYEKLGIKDQISFKINNIGIFRKLFTWISMDDQLQEHVLHLLDKGKTDEAKQLFDEKVSLNQNIRRFMDLLVDRGNNIKLEEVRSEAEKTGLPTLMEEIDKLEFIDKMLSSMRLNHITDFSFVRGLAYYTGPIFEVVKKDLPFSIAGGGRYDTLVEIYGGNKTPAVGFAIGVERTIFFALNTEKLVLTNNSPIVAVIALENSVITEALRIISKLRNQDIITILNEKNIPLSKLVPFYAEQGFTHLVIVGKKEVESGKVTIRNLATREQRLVNFNELDKFPL